MKLVKNKNVSLGLVLVVIATALFLAVKVISAIIDKSNPIIISIYGTFFVFDIVLYLIYALRPEKINIQRNCKWVSIYNLSVALIYWALTVLMSVFSVNMNDVLFYLTIGAALLLIASRILLAVFLSKNYSNKTSGYVLFRYVNYINIIYDSIIILGISICFFIRSYLKTIIDNPPTSIEQIPSEFFISLLIYFVISLVALFLIIFISILLYISGKENKSLDFQHKFKSSIKTIHKYRLGFAFGIAANSFLLLIAILSTLVIDQTNLILVFLFNFVILIKIPEFYWNKALEKKYKGEELFIKKHQISLYASLFFIAYSILQLFFGNASFVNYAHGGTHSLVITLVIFAPYAIGKSIKGIIAIKNTRKSKDPVIEIEAYTSGIVAIYTVNNLFLTLTSLTKSPILLTISIAIVIGTLIYTLGIGAYIFIISILGLAKKRTSECETFINYRKNKESSDIISEEITNL